MYLLDALCTITIRCMRHQGRDMCNLEIGLDNVAASSIDGGAYLLCKDEVKRQGKQATMLMKFNLSICMF